MKRTVALICLMLAAVAGCGTPCSEIARHRQEFLDRRPPPATSEPHLVAAVPLARVNRTLAPRVAALEPLPLELPDGGLLDQYLEGFFLRPRAAELVPAAGGQVGIVLMLDVIRRDQVFFSMRVEGEIQPRFVPDRNEVEVELRAENFQSMEPELQGDAQAQLGRALHRMLPGMARVLISPEQIGALAGTITSFVLSTSYPMLREGLFRGLEPLARFTVVLPDLPIQGLTFSTVPDAGGQLVLSGTTSLPVSAGLSPGTVLEPSSEAISLLVAGPVVAELANWAMARGRIPSRYDERGHPDENGPYDVALSWSTAEGEERPLRVHVWRLEERCLRAVMSARPELHVRGGELVLDVQDRHVDELEGPPMAEVARWFAPIWLRAMNHTGAAASTLRLEVAGRPLRAEVVDIERLGGAVRLELDLVEARPPAGARAPARTPGTRRNRHPVHPVRHASGTDTGLI